MKRITGIALALTVLAGGTLAGCGSQATPAPGAAAGTTAPAAKAAPVTVTWWQATATPERNAVFEELVKQVHTTYPEITLDYLGIPGDLAAYRQKCDMAIAAGQAPDIGLEFSASNISRNVLEPLDTYFDAWKDKGLINEANIKSNRAMDVKNGKLFGMPDSTQTWNLWIRPDWFKEAGIAVPADWNGMFDAIRKLTDKSKGRYGLSIRGGAGSANTLEMLMYSYSGIGEYFTKDGKSTLNDPLNVEFVEKYLGMYSVYTPEDDLNKGWTELAATFQSGKAAVVAHNLGSASSHDKAFNGDKSKYQAIPFPKGVKGYSQHPALMPKGTTLSAASKNKDAAWKVITVAASKDFNGLSAKTYGEIPANKDAAKAAWISELPYMKASADLLADTNTHYGSNPYQMPTYTNIQAKTAEPMIQKVMAKKMTAKEMLDEWAKAMEKEKAAFDAANK